MIENELKYVLALTTNPQPLGVPRKMITQGYLDRSARVRQTSVASPVGIKQIETTNKFTYKVGLPNGEMEEFEKTISTSEFERCFEIATNKLFKHRYTFQSSEAQWDLDFFYDANDQLYFCMAECEMPSGWIQPKKLPKIIERNLLFAVPREDSKFYSSKRISDPKYAAELLAKHEAVSIPS